MITINNLKEVLIALGFTQTKDIFNKTYTNGATISVDFKNGKIIYPSELKKGDTTTSNLSHPENFVVLECVHRLLEKGYKAKHIELEPRWKLGRESKTSGKADIVVKNQKNETYIIIECKTFGTEFSKERKNMEQNGGQLFSYFQQDKNAHFLCLYASDFDEKIINEQYIISVKDNERFLQEKSKENKGYKSANTVEDLHNVWREIYEANYSTKGIFEETINAYDAGKQAHCLADLKEISQKDSGGKSGEDGKYHEFAKILRKHNISGKENAFDKLVNLWLCKIYDEKYNQNNLAFSYRGVMSDSFESLQDRLMLLYKNAMKTYLNEEITYVSDEQINEQFEDFKANKIKTNALKEQMHEFLRQLKFYSHSDFSFLEVHNKKLFAKNGEVLREVVRLFQDYKLTQNSTTQFLSNMFELFLQKGMKQDEGQFFTPLQICEFIMYSLPLAEMLEQNPKLKVIDYACGAGHFLNTYANVATQINPNHKSDIYGIEKEYRLSKVSKVSSAMYAHDIKFTYADALDKESFKEQDFNLLVANPPYSVKGFLETLDDSTRKSYELFSENLNIETNAIECFFIERANNLLKSSAKTAIILPSSILNKDGIYEKAREIILRNFEIISICELPSGTFGATGTNTIILFLSKKPTYQNTHDSQAYKNLIENIDILNPYTREFLGSYCAMQNYNLSSYENFLNGVLCDDLISHEIFVEYKIAFDRLKKKGEFIDFCSNIEKEKFLYFSLIKGQKTMIIKAPSDNKAIKKFLGYEWSNAKGNEGLHELNEPYTTPLYERENIENKNKIAYLIRQAFLNGEIEISPELSDFAIHAPLHSCIDFKSANFNKAINLSLATAATINPFENSSFELVKLETCGEFYMGGTPSRKNFDYWQNGTIKWLTIGDYKNFDLITQTQELITQSGLENSSAKIIKKGAVVVSIYATLGRVGILGDDMATNQAIVAIVTNDECLNKFIMYIIDFGKNALISKAKTTTQKNISLDTLKNFKIPLPPLDVQKQIIAECESVENENSRILTEIAEQKEQINRVLAKTGILNVEFQDNENLKDLPSPQDYGLIEWESVKIEKVIDINKISKNPTNEPDKDFIYIDIDAVENGTGKFSTNKIILGKEAPSRARRYATKNSTLISTVRPNLKAFTFIDEEIENAVYSTGFAILNSKDINILIDKMIFYCFMYSSMLMQQIESAMPKGQYPSINKSDIENFKIPLPPLEAQEKIVQAIEICENKIKELENKAESLKDKTGEILRKYLF